MSKSFLPSVIKQFRYYKSLGEKTFDQVGDDDLIWQYNPESNSIAIIVKHLWGNMMSRWTNFLAEDGEKAWRQREAEFDADIKTRQEMLEKWEAGWACLLTALDAIDPDDLERLIYIRNQGHTIAEAINRQLAHYAYHVGQIVYLGRMLSGAEWQSLSIPRGQSQSYNQQKFGKQKDRGHFTDEFLK